MALQRRRSEYPYREVVTLADLHLTPEQLAAEAVRSARAGVEAFEEVGLDPGEALRRRAAGDPDLVADFVREHTALADPGDAVA